jgi:hypothetical protein
MRAIFPIGTKIKKFNNKTNIIAQLQSIFDKEINKFYLPLSKEPFDKTKIKKEKGKNEIKNKTKKIKKESK